MLRHLIDGKAWNNFDCNLPAFTNEPRNKMLGLTVNGFNPFGNMSLSYSISTVILTAYNLPHWLSMKDSYFILTLLIPGLQVLGKDMDVFLQPLINELKYLWVPRLET